MIDGSCCDSCIVLDLLNDLPEVPSEKKKKEKHSCIPDRFPIPHGFLLGKKLLTVPSSNLT